MKLMARDRGALREINVAFAVADEMITRAPQRGGMIP